MQFQLFVTWCSVSLWLCFECAMHGLSFQQTNTKLEKLKKNAQKKWENTNKARFSNMGLHVVGCHLKHCGKDWTAHFSKTKLKQVIIDFRYYVCRLPTDLWCYNKCHCFAGVRVSSLTRTHKYKHILAHVWYLWPCTRDSNKTGNYAVPSHTPLSSFHPGTKQKCYSLAFDFTLNNKTHTKKEAFNLSKIHQTNAKQLTSNILNYIWKKKSFLWLQNAQLNANVFELSKHESQMPFVQ